MNSTACNYDSNATDDDGSCAIIDECGVCGGEGIADGACDCSGNVLDDCGVCGGTGTLSCGLTGACNYDAAATCFDNSVCDFESCTGCTDDEACNYDPSATINGACTWPALDWLDCAGNCLPGFDENNNGICDPTEIPGCIDEAALNYNPAATIDDGSCLESIVGCGNFNACNYNPLATVAGECTFSDFGYNCEGSCIVDSDGDDVCDVFEVYGCTTPGPGYNPFATEDDGSCLVGGCIIPSPNFACNFDPDADYLIPSMCFNPPCLTGDMAGNPTPLGMLVPGCTEPFACNYDPLASEDDGSCEYASCLGCNDVSACNYDEDVIYNDGSCDYLSCAVMGCTNLNACNYDEEATMFDGSCEFTSCAGCLDTEAANYDPTATLDNGTCEFPGCTISGACNYDSTANSLDDSCEFASCSGCLNESACNFDPSAEIAGSCDFVSCQGCTDAMADNYDADATQDDGSCLISGCTVLLACNFDVNANDPDFGSCEFPVFPSDCDGGCMNDVDEDGVCDEFEVLGCTDVFACNFDADATDDDNGCAYAAFGLDCNENCIIDTDEDGVCEQDEVTGCQDDMACNYDASATDSGYCDYADAGYDCSGACLNDLDNDGVCDADEVYGCADSEAINFQPLSTESTDTCLYPEDFEPDCMFDTTGDGYVGTADLLDFLGNLGSICP